MHKRTASTPSAFSSINNLVFDPNIIYVEFEAGLAVYKALYKHKIDTAYIE